MTDMTDKCRFSKEFPVGGYCNLTMQKQGLSVISVIEVAK